MDIIIEFWGRKSLGVECNRVQFAIRSHNGKDSSKCIVRGISLNCNLSDWDPMGKDWSCGESLLSASKAEWHSSEKCQGVPLWVRCISRTVMSVNEMIVDIGKAKERLNILDFSWYWPILD